MYQEDMKEKYAHLKTQLAKYIGDEVCCLLTMNQASSALRERNLKTEQSAAILDLCLRETRAGNHVIILTYIIFATLRF